MHKKSRTNFLKLLIVVFVLLVLLYFLFFFTNNKNIYREILAKDDSNVANFLSAPLTPSTDDKENNTSEETLVREEYVVANDAPKFINIFSINTVANIQEVGINAENEIAVPDSSDFVGWYKYSVKPGEKGLSIIDGHVDSIGGAGEFRNIKELKAEDVFTVVYGDDHEVNFQVVDVEQVPLAQAYNVLFSKRSDIDSQLNLITCGGKYNAESQKYDDRIIVITKKV